MDQQQIYQYIMAAMQQGGTPQQIITALSPYAPGEAIAQVMTAVLSQQQPQQAPAFQPTPWGQQAPQPAFNPAFGITGAPPAGQQFQQQAPQGFQAPASFGGQAQASGGASGGSLGAQQVQRYGEQLAGAKAGNAHGRQLPNGTHLLEVTEVSAKPTYYGDKFFVEYVVLESTNPETEIGGIYSKGYAFVDKYGHGQNDIKGWLCIAVSHRLGKNARVEWDARFLDWAINPQQPCKGMILRADTWERPPSKQGGNAVNIHEWQAMPDGTRSIGLTAAAHAPTTMQAAPAFAPPPQFQQQAPPQFQQQANPAAMVQQPGAFQPPPPGFGQAPPSGSLPQPPASFQQGAAPGPQLAPHIAAMLQQAR